MSRLLVILLVATLASCRKPDDSLKANLGEHRIHISGMDGFKISKKKTMFSKGTKIEEIKAARNGERVQMEILSAVSDTAAAGYVQKNVNLLESIYKGYKNPYPGAISSEVVCDGRFWPKVKKKQDGRQIFYQAYANSRFALGACAEEDIAYQATFVLVRCTKTKTVFYLKYFMPQKKPKSLRKAKLPEIDC